MPENTPQSPNSNKKARLGRGLNSLFGGMDSPVTQPANQVPTPAQPAPQVNTQTQATKHNAGQPSAQTLVQTSAPVQTSTEAKKSADAVSAAAATLAANTTASVPTKEEVVPGAKAELKTALAAASAGTSVSSQVAPVKAAAASAAPASAATSASSQKTSSASVVTPVPVARPINEEAQIWMIPVERLQPNTQQPRQVFTPEGLKDLTASVKEKGILQPIVARRLGEREFEIIAGERRWRAAQAAGLLQVPVILKKVSQQDSLELAIIENIQRENLNPIDEAEAYQLLLTDYSLTQQQVADKMGKDRSSVANSLRLLSLPGEVRMMLKGEQLSTGHAKVLLGLEDKSEQVKIAQLVLSDKLSVRATEKLVAKAKTDARAGSSKEEKGVGLPDISQRLVEGLGLELQKLIGSKVVIDYADSKGKIALHFYSDDQFNQMVEKLRKAWEK